MELLELAAVPGDSGRLDAWLAAQCPTLSRSALQGLIEQPVTPMLKPPRSVRTLILPYADRQRPDRLYMPRYVYSLVERPQWVVGDYLVAPVSPASRVNVLEQVRDHLDDGQNEVGPRP